MRQNYFKEVCFYYLFRSALLNSQISECTEDVDKIDRLSLYLPPLLLLERNSIDHRTQHPPHQSAHHTKYVQVCGVPSELSHSGLGR